MKALTVKPQFIRFVLTLWSSLMIFSGAAETMRTTMMIHSRLAFLKRSAHYLGRRHFLATEPKRRRLRDVVPHVVRLKFCNDMEQDVASDNEWDYANYKVELDPDLPPV